eukprot:g230.t1
MEFAVVLENDVVEDDVAEDDKAVGGTIVMETLKRYIYNMRNVSQDPKMKGVLSEEDREKLKTESEKQLEWLKEHHTEGKATLEGKLAEVKAYLAPIRGKISASLKRRKSRAAAKSNGATEKVETNGAGGDAAPPVAPDSDVGRILPYLDIHSLTQLSFNSVFLNDVTIQYWRSLKSLQITGRLARNNDFVAFLGRHCRELNDLLLVSAWGPRAMNIIRDEKYVAERAKRGENKASDGEEKDENVPLHRSDSKQAVAHLFIRFLQSRKTEVSQFRNMLLNLYQLLHIHLTSVKRLRLQCCPEFFYVLPKPDSVDSIEEVLAICHENRLNGNESVLKIDNWLLNTRFTHLEGFIQNFITEIQVPPATRLPQHNRNDMDRTSTAESTLARQIRESDFERECEENLTPLPLESLELCGSNTFQCIHLIKACGKSGALKHLRLGRNIAASCVCGRVRRCKNMGNNDTNNNSCLSQSGSSNDSQHEEATDVSAARLLAFCSRCKQVRYCNKSCQEADWDREHRFVCEALHVHCWPSRPRCKLNLLQAILQCKNLKSLDLRNVRLKSSGLELIATQLNALHTLRADRVANSGSLDRALDALGQLKHFRQLQLQRTPGVTDYNLKMFLSKKTSSSVQESKFNFNHTCGSRLELLDLFGCTGLSENSVHVICEMCPNLVVLNSAWGVLLSSSNGLVQSGLSMKCIEKLIINLPFLRTLVAVSIEAKHLKQSEEKANASTVRKSERCSYIDRACEYLCSSLPATRKAELCLFMHGETMTTSSEHRLTYARLAWDAPKFCSTHTESVKKNKLNEVFAWDRFEWRSEEDNEKQRRKLAKLYCESYEYGAALLSGRLEDGTR